MGINKEQLLKVIMMEVERCLGYEEALTKSSIIIKHVNIMVKEIENKNNSIGDIK